MVAGLSGDLGRGTAVILTKPGLCLPWLIILRRSSQHSLVLLHIQPFLGIRLDSSADSDEFIEIIKFLVKSLLRLGTRSARGLSLDSRRPSRSLSLIGEDVNVSHVSLVLGGQAHDLL